MAIQLAANLTLLFDAQVSWPERCERAAAQGFLFAEVLFPYDRPATHYRRWLEAAGLQTMLINTPVDGHFGLAAVEGAQKRFRQDLDRAIAVGNELGASAIHVMAGQAEPGGPSVSQTCLLANLEYALKRVEGSQLVLMLEALNQRDVPGYLYNHPAQVAAIIETLASPRLRQQFDFYHTLQEGLTLVDELERCRAGIGHIQIAQPPTRCEPSVRQGGMLDALRRLAATGYEGKLGCEYYPANGFEQGLEWLDTLYADEVVRPLKPRNRPL